MREYGIFYFWKSAHWGIALTTSREARIALSEWSFAISVVDLQRCLRMDYFAIITERRTFVTKHTNSSLWCLSCVDGSINMVWCCTYLNKHNHYVLSFLIAFITPIQIHSYIPSSSYRSKPFCFQNTFFLFVFVSLYFFNPKSKLNTKFPKKTSAQAAVTSQNATQKPRSHIDGTYWQHTP